MGFVSVVLRDTGATRGFWGLWYTLGMLWGFWNSGNALGPASPGVFWASSGWEIRGSEFSRWNIPSWNWIFLVSGAPCALFSLGVAKTVSVQYLGGCH